MLLDFVPAPVRALRESESIAPNDHAILQDHSISDPAVFPHHGLRMRQELVSYFYVFIEGHQAMKHGVSPNFHAFIDETVGPDVGAFADPCRFGHHRRRMNSWKILLRRVKEFDGPREIEVRVIRSQCSGRGQFRAAFNNGLALDNHGRRASRGQLTPIPRVRQKADFTLRGSFQPFRPMNLNLCVAFERAAKACSQFSKFHFSISSNRRTARVQKSLQIGRITLQHSCVALKFGLGGVRSLVEKARLNGRGRLSPCDANDAENRHLRERGAWNKNPQRCPMKVRRRNLDATVKQRKQIVGDNAFDAVIVAKFQTYPETLQLWPRQKRFALGFKIIGEFTHEINAAHILARNRAMLALGSEQVDCFGLTQSSRIQVPAQYAAVEQQYDDLLVCGG